MAAMIETSAVLDDYGIGSVVEPILKRKKSSFAEQKISLQNAGKRQITANLKMECLIYNLSTNWSSSSHITGSSTGHVTTYCI